MSRGMPTNRTTLRKVAGFLGRRLSRTKAPAPNAVKLLRVCYGILDLGIPLRGVLVPSLNRSSQEHLDALLASRISDARTINGVLALGATLDTIRQSLDAQEDRANSPSRRILALVTGVKVPPKPKPRRLKPLQEVCVHAELRDAD